VDEDNTPPVVEPRLGRGSCPSFWVSARSQCGACSTRNPATVGLRRMLGPFLKFFLTSLAIPIRRLTWNFCREFLTLDLGLGGARVPKQSEVLCEKYPLSDPQSSPTLLSETRAVSCDDAAAVSRMQMYAKGKGLKRERAQEVSKGQL